MKRFAAFVVALFLLIQLPPLWGQELDHNMTSTEAVEKILNSLDLRQKVGQMLILGFSGTTLKPALQGVLAHIKPGAIIVFSRNIQSFEQIARLNREAQTIALEQSNLPLFIMTDQEGGNVSRIKTKPLSPSALALGQTRDPDLVKNVGRVNGQILSLLGFNVNLAPVFDLADPAKANFIGNRSFGKNPQDVAQLALAFSEGLSANGVIPTGKHFPGHGATLQDSHRKTPIRQISLEELNKNDLVPFQEFMKMNSPSAIMASHVAFPKIDNSGLPTAFSKQLMTSVLRNQLGYNDLAITDDIEMQGANLAGDIGERTLRAIEAGNDMVMVAWSPQRQQRAFNALLNAVIKKRISEARINESLRRIIAHKIRIQDQVATETLNKEILMPALQEAFADLKELSQTVSEINFKNAAKINSHLQGFLSPEQKIVLFSSDAEAALQLKRSCRNQFKFVQLMPNRVVSIAKELQKSEALLGVYYITGTKTAKALTHIPTHLRQRLIVINTSHPGIISNRRDFLGIFDVATANAESASWLGEFLTTAPDIRSPADVAETHEHLKSTAPETKTH